MLMLLSQVLVPPATVLLMTGMLRTLLRTYFIRLVL